MLMVDPDRGGGGGRAPVVTPKTPPPAPPSLPPALVAPVATTPSPAPYSAPAPAPAPVPSLVSPNNTMTSPNGSQTTPLIGTPTGYSTGTGIDTSTQALLPTNFNTDTMTGKPVADATTPAAQTYIDQNKVVANTPTTWNVTPDQTVQGQYKDLMSQGNEAIQAAEEATTRKYAASGGRNNLMADNAASLTGSQVALTIATTDAATKAQAGQFNASAANDFKKAQDAFNQNALLSRQNFDQAVATLKDQTAQNTLQLYAQVQANAATQSTNLKASLDQIQAQTNAQLETMDKTFAQNVATMGLQQQFANDNAWTNYGMQVRTAYLSSVNTQQTSLMQTISDIRSNPNVTTAQAESAIKDAVTQFNSFMDMNNAYYSAMVPNGSGSTYGVYP